MTVVAPKTDDNADARTRLISRALSAATLSAALVTASSATASDFPCQPVSWSSKTPRFHAARMLNLADHHKAPADESGLANDAVDSFVRSLQLRLLSAFSPEVTDAIFGDNAQDAGVITSEDQTVSFERGAASVIVSIADETTGSRTDVCIPLFVVNGA